MSSASSLELVDSDSGKSSCSNYLSVITPATSAVKTIIKMTSLIRSGKFNVAEVMKMLEKLGSEMKEMGQQVSIFLETCSFRRDLREDVDSDLNVSDRIKLIQITINRDLKIVINLVNCCEGKDGLDSKKLLLTSHALAQDLKNLVDTVRESGDK